MTITERSPGTALVIAGQIITPALFEDPKSLDDVVSKLEREVRATPRDISTEVGRAQIASVAYKIARSKTALDEMGKELVSDWKQKSNKVDEERRKLRGRLDALKDEFRAPLTEWEEAEKARVQTHENHLAAIEALGNGLIALNSNQLCERIIELGRLFGRDWQEFAVRAAQTCDAATLRLQRKLAEVRAAEAELAEQRHREREEAERLQREREERIAAEARREAEQRAAAAERAHKEAEEFAERGRVFDHERALATVRSYQTVDPARSSEQLEGAQEALGIFYRGRDWQEFAQQAADAFTDSRSSLSTKIAHARQREEQHRRDREARIAEDAAAAERQRIADEQAAAAEEAERRENNKRIRARVNNEAAGGIVQAGGVSMDVAKAIVTAIAQGRVRHVSIEY